ncbi:tyrosine--tRNA ligase 2, cytoplasmic-like [Triticum dicoccoides]|uniref:tyrosine--tRNA ligase 2, cytoplasmic-like n=1 Tax=Triticum dicoccoides TaxID=85692 RepID=UPI001891909E|nr:tyrosine--tRNA ligase 2, cytoplasmic-like [Triticum dicoccoides]
MAINVNKLLEAGCKVKIFMANWFALTSYSVSLRKVIDVCSYNTEMWRTAGMRIDEVELVRSSDEISRDLHRYWPLALKVARSTNLSEVTECILSSKDTRPYYDEPKSLFSHEVFGTCMHSAAILSRDEADVWLLDVGQRASNKVAERYREREAAMREDPHRRVVALFHGVLPSLLEYPEIEMFGDPRWAIYMEDTEWEVGRAMRKAFCPPGTVEGNPCLEYIRQIIFPLFGKFEVVREDGSDRTFLSMEELAADYESGALQAADVKRALEKAINAALQPVRDHFSFASNRPMKRR